MKIDSELRPCLVDGKKAVFHCWEQCAKVLEPSLIKGGHNKTAAKAKIEVERIDTTKFKAETETEL